MKKTFKASAVIWAMGARSVNTLAYEFEFLKGAGQYGYQRI